MPGSHLEQCRRQWCMTVISNDSGKHFNEWPLTEPASVVGYSTWALSNWLLEWEMTLHLSHAVRGVVGAGSLWKSNVRFGVFSCQAPVDEGMKQLQLCELFKITPAVGLCSCCFFLQCGKYTEPGFWVALLCHISSIRLYRLGNSVTGRKMDRTYPANHISHSLMLLFLFLFSILQNSVCCEGVWSVYFIIGAYPSVHSGYTVMCVFSLPDIWGPECNPGYWCDSSSACWERWHHCWGMLCLFCGLLTSKCREGFKRLIPSLQTENHQDLLKHGIAVSRMQAELYIKSYPLIVTDKAGFHGSFQLVVAVGRLCLSPHKWKTASGCDCRRVQ